MYPPGKRNISTQKGTFEEYDFPAFFEVGYVSSMEGMSQNESFCCFQLDHVFLLPLLFLVGGFNPI